MWLLAAWARRSNENAVRSAREAATALARRRVEANGVELFLAEEAGRRSERHRWEPHLRLSAAGRARH